MTDTVVVGSEPGEVNFNLAKRGDKIGPVDFIWPDGSDLSDRTWAAQIRGDLDGGGLVAAFTVDDSHGADDTEPKLTISLVHTQSKLLVTPHPATPDLPEVPGEGVYYWDLQSTKKTDAEDVHTPFSGVINVGGDATHPDEDA